MLVNDNNLDRFQAQEQQPCYHDDVLLQQSHDHLVVVLIAWMKIDQSPALGVPEMTRDDCYDDILSHSIPNMLKW